MTIVKLKENFEALSEPWPQKISVEHYMGQFPYTLRVASVTDQNYNGTFPQCYWKGQKVPLLIREIADLCV